ncbi:MAG: RNase adapter RapZ [Ruminococcaceae bacterium]|nr:RNase adapter RapZ [Oscillospiraceae bacterium]
MELLIVTGMSGAGKSHAANVLEDIGFYCVDNIPPSLIVTLADMMAANKEIEKAAVVTDVRVGRHFSDISHVLDRLTEQKINYKIMFLDCADDVLVRRYKETRRKHPLVTAGVTLTDAVKKERELLRSIRERADYVFMTSQTSVKQIREQISSLFLNNLSDSMSVRVMSFGFKHGPAAEADLMFDVRCLPNPFYIDELRPLTGLDSEIKDYVLNNDISREFRARLLSFIEYAMPLYCSEGKSQLVIAVGCTGGKHRSVVFTELIAEHLKQNGYNVDITHRDITK